MKHAKNDFIVISNDTSNGLGKSMLQETFFKYDFQFNIFNFKDSIK